MVRKTGSYIKTWHRGRWMGKRNNRLDRKINRWGTWVVKRPALFASRNDLMVHGSWDQALPQVPS